MTLSITTQRVNYTGDGSTTVFAYTWKIFVNTELRVILRNSSTLAETVQTLTTHYTVSGVGESTGGNVTFVTAPTSGYTVTIMRVRPYTQITDIRNAGERYLETFEDTFDKLVMNDQQLDEVGDRSVRLAETEAVSGFSPVFPAGVAGRVSSAPITNSGGTGWADVADWPSASEISNASTYATQAAASAAAAAVSSGTLSPYGINNLGLSATVAANALTFAILEADGSSTPSTGTDSVTIYFRSTTATTGSMTARSVTGATTLVVPNTATLGHNDALEDYIYIYAIDNAGTVELACSSSSHWDEGQLVTTTAISTSSDDAATMYSTTQRTNVACRLIGRVLSTQTTAGTWASAMTRLEVGFLFKKEDIAFTRAAAFTAKHGGCYYVSTAATRNVQLPVPRAGFKFWIKDATGSGAQANAITLVRNGSEAIDAVSSNYTCNTFRGSYLVKSDGTNWFIFHDVKGPLGNIFVDTGNGHGSGNVAIRRFSNTRSSGGTSITYADSATNGGSFTINETGIYQISYGDGGAAGSSMGISVNSSQLTTNIGSVSYANGKRAISFQNTATTLYTVSITLRLASGDIVRAHTNTVPDLANDNCFFSITQVSRLTQ